MASPVRPFRLPRFSMTPSDENRPAFFDPDDSNVVDPSTAFPRQLISSPSKYQDRSVLLLLGNKVPSSVPGRRSSIACTKDRKALAPLIIFEDDTPGADDESTTSPRPLKQIRSRSMKPLGNTNRAIYTQNKNHGKSLRRL
jgi:hypothetical protein